MPKRWLLLCAVLLCCVGCDQATKSIAKSTLPRTHAITWLGDSVRLQVVYNPGAFLGLGRQLPETTRRQVFTVGTATLLLGVLLTTFSSAARRREVVLALALVFAGGASNLIDRWTHDGHVVDFLNVGIGPLRTGVFNVADMAIMAGGALLLLATLREKQRAR